MGVTEEPRLRRGQEISLEVDGIDGQGEGIARADGREFRVPLAVPGDRVRVRALRPGRHPVPTAPLERERAAPSRTAPACPHYVEGCGGCCWQDVHYSEQLRLKEQIVRANLWSGTRNQGPGTGDGGSSAGGGAGGGERIRAIQGVETPWFYRNKMEFTFGQGPALGLHRRGRYWDVLDILDCRLQSRLSNEIRNAVRAFAMAHGWAPYQKRAHTGEARHLVIREGKRTGEVLVNLASRSEDLPGVEELARELAGRFPQIASLYWTISPEKGDAIKARKETLLFGKPRIRETLDGIEFLIGPGAFFQTNTEQAERLCAVVAELREAAGHGPDPVVLDLYCGVGAFALSTARRAPGARVFGVELADESVASACENAAGNGLSRVEFLAGDVGKRLPEAVSTVGRPDVVIVDPPRAGLAPDVARDLLALAPAQILYVSCSPVVLGRDLAPLTAQGYAVTAVQPVDLFPHTRHVETVVSLTRAG